MKGNNMGRGLKALAVSLAVGLGMTACSRDYTVGYLYVTNAKATPGLITAYAIDYESGALTQLADSPIPAGGNNPVTLVASPNSKYLYVLNHDTSTVVEYSIGTDGKIYPANTYSVVQGNNVIGTFPTAAAIDPAGKVPLCHLYLPERLYHGQSRTRRPRNLPDQRRRFPGRRADHYKRRHDASLRQAGE